MKAWLWAHFEFFLMYVLPGLLLCGWFGLLLCVLWNLPESVKGVLP